MRPTDETPFGWVRLGCRIVDHVYRAAFTLEVPSRKAVALWLTSTEAKSSKSLCCVEVSTEARVTPPKLIPESSPDESTINPGALPGVEALNSAVLAVIFWG